MTRKYASEHPFASEASRQTSHASTKFLLLRMQKSLLRHCADWNRNLLDSLKLPVRSIKNVIEVVAPVNHTGPGAAKIGWASPVCVVVGNDTGEFCLANCVGDGNECRVRDAGVLGAVSEVKLGPWAKRRDSASEAEPCWSICIRERISIPIIMMLT